MRGERLLAPLRPEAYSSRGPRRDRGRWLMLRTATEMCRVRRSSAPHAGAEQGSHAITWCTGWASASTPCAFVHEASRRGARPAGPVRRACKNTKPLRALAALLSEADARSQRDAPEPEARASKKGADGGGAAATTTTGGLAAAPLRVPDGLAAARRRSHGSAGSWLQRGARDASIVATHNGCTAMNCQLTYVDAASETNSFYRLQCFKFERGGFGIFTRWGRVGEDGRSA